VEPPIINISGPSNASANQSIIFDASDCIDPDGTIVEYFWDFGDGTTATGKTPEHTFIKPGVYTITLLVTDDTGTTYSKTFTVVIEAGSEESFLKRMNLF
jgi:PKD repeat protein